MPTRKEIIRDIRWLSSSEIMYLDKELQKRGLSQFSLEELHSLSKKGVKRLNYLNWIVDRLEECRDD